MLQKYVKQKGQNTWHWVSNCSHYPKNDVIQNAGHPNKPKDGSFCPECSQKETSRGAQSAHGKNAESERFGNRGTEIGKATRNVGENVKSNELNRRQSQNEDLHTGFDKEGSAQRRQTESEDFGRQARPGNDRTHGNKENERNRPGSQQDRFHREDQHKEQNRDKQQPFRPTPGKR